MRFKEFLGEKVITTPFTDTVNEQELLKWATRHSRQYILNILSEKNVIVRGVPSDAEFSIGDSSKFKRKSAYTRNFVNSFIATSPRWKDYPSRESAFICADNFYVAEKYSKGADPYLVIPADDAHIGVCPADDFWPSFKSGFDKAGIKGIETVKDLNDWLATYWPDLPEDDPKFMRMDLEEIDREEIMTLKSQAIKLSVVGAMNKYEVDNLHDLLEIVLGPELNKFSKMKATEYFKHTGNREVWVAGKCAFMKVDRDNITEKIEWLKNAI